MKWMRLKNYLAPSFMKEVDLASEIYMNLIRDLHDENNFEKNEEYSNLRESIIERIDEIDKFYEMNFDQPYINHFERGRIKLKKLLMYEPNIFNQYDNEDDDKEMSYNNEAMNEENSNGNIITEIKPKTPKKIQPSKTPLITYSNTTHTEAIKTSVKKPYLPSNANKQHKIAYTPNINQTTNKKVIPAKPNQAHNHNNILKKEIDNCQITLHNQTNDNTYYQKKNQREVTDYYNSNNRNHNLQENDSYADDENYNDGECSRNFKSNDSSNRRFKGNNSDNNYTNQDYFHKKDKSNNREKEPYDNLDSKNQTKNTFRSNINNDCDDSNQFDTSINKHSFNKNNIYNSNNHNDGNNSNLRGMSLITNTNPIHNNNNNKKPKSDNQTNKKEEQEKLRALETEPREIMVKFKLTEEEYRHFVEEKNKLIMKCLLDQSNMKKKY